MIERLAEILLEPEGDQLPPEGESDSVFEGLEEPVPEPSWGRPAAPGQGISIGLLVGRTAAGEFLVEYAHHAARLRLPARSVVAWEAGGVGREVVLLFEGGDPLKPVVLGYLQEPSAPPDGPRGGPGLPVEARVDGRKLVVTAEEEIVFRCGKASITLTRVGKILIRGEYVLSRSSGVNSIKGGVVQIN